MIHNSHFKNNGQVMLLAVLVLSGTILGATTIAGLLMLNQIWQATNVGHSTQAIFAADTGVEWELFKLFQPDTADANPDLAPIMTNRTCIQTALKNSVLQSVGCAGGRIDTRCDSAPRCPRPVNRAFEVVLESL